MAFQISGKGKRMKKVKHDILLKLVKVLNVLLMTIAFSGCWYLYYGDRLVSPFYRNGNYLVIALFMIIYCGCCNVYEALIVSMKQISEMVYSQFLAALETDVVMFIITWLLTKSLPNVWPLIGTLVVQLVLAVIWSYNANHWYFRTFPPQKTAIIHDAREGLQDLVQEYGLTKKYEIQQLISVSECLQDLSLLKGMETVFLSGVHSHDRNIILKYCIAEDIEVMVIPRIGDVLMSSSKAIHMFHLPMLQVRRYNASPEFLAIKRLMDIVISLIALIVLSPIMLIVALAIKLYDGGPILYSQVRLTKDGKLFHIHKFRSMRTDAEKDGVARLSTGENDDRITPIGKVIRKLRLDELPQLWDILHGDLSVVGPRPERPEIAQQYMEEMPEFALRLQAKAGLTGYAQVYGKYNTTPYDKLQMDLTYIAHPSIVEDLKIMMATIKILFMAESTEGVAEGQTTANK